MAPMVIALCPLEHANGQQQSYNGATFRTVRGLRAAAMRLGNCIYKGKAKAVTGRMFSLHESLESQAADFRRESRTIVFNHQCCRSLMRTQPDFYPASRRQMSQFVFKQIAYCPIQQGHVSV